jgi:urease accessory protein UreF
LRYHLQYREDRGKPLRLIVEFLRGFYSRQRLLDELADAVPDSPVERHLQYALDASNNWLARGALDRPKALLASVRIWMVDGQQELRDVAIVLEAILVAALDISPRRAVPRHLTQIVANAIAVQLDSDQFEERLLASLQNLRLQDWESDASDALEVFEFLCSARDDGPYKLDDDQCAALRERHISAPALTLRFVMATALRQDGKVDKALGALDDILDDIDGVDTVAESDRNMVWALWFEAIPAANKQPRTRAGNVEIGWVLAIALRRGVVQPEEFDTVMAAFTENTRGAVAATVAMAAHVLGIEMPAKHDPRKYVDDELLAPVARFIAQQAKSSPAESDS